MIPTAVHVPKYSNCDCCDGFVEFCACTQKNNELFCMCQAVESEKVERDRRNRTPCLPVFGTVDPPLASTTSTKINTPTLIGGGVILFEKEKESPNSSSISTTCICCSGDIYKCMCLDDGMSRCLVCYFDKAASNCACCKGYKFNCKCMLELDFDVCVCAHENVKNVEAPTPPKPPRNSGITHQLQTTNIDKHNHNSCLVVDDNNNKIDNENGVNKEQFSKLIDRNGSGLLSQSDARYTCHNLGMALTDRQLSEIFIETKTNKEGLISVDDVVDYIISLQEGITTTECSTILKTADTSSTDICKLCYSRTSGKSVVGYDDGFIIDLTNNSSISTCICCSGDIYKCMCLDDGMSRCLVCYFDKAASNCACCKGYKFNCKCLLGDE